jgi:4-hydroxy-tetrahydrodipicolinate reductase
MERRFAMKPIEAMVNGLPGKMAQAVARCVQSDERFALIPYSLTGPEIDAPDWSVAGKTVRLVRPDARGRVLPQIQAAYPNFISIDFTHPGAVNANASFYCENRLPFVMGTTGGDRKLLEETVKASGTAAVVAPNMAKQIVGLQAMMAYAAAAFPNLFQGYHLEVRESHQKGKADTSGTAKAMVKYFNALGIPFEESHIHKERDPQRQKSLWGIPEEHLTGHGWHTYVLTSPDGTVRLEFTHNVNGREVYALGTLDAVRFLHARIGEGARGQIFSMIDVLKGGDR